MKSAQVIAAVIRHLGFGRRGWVMARWTPDKWFECDLAHISVAGYLTEYEVKLTRSDFHADARKRGRQSYYARYAGLPPGPTKHDRLEARDPHGPSRFFFVVPEGLVEPSELPEWAGLMIIPERYENIYIQPSVAAPRLHRTPLGERQLERLRATAYYRYVHDVLLKPSLRREEKK